MKLRWGKSFNSTGPVGETKVQKIQVSSERGNPVPFNYLFEGGDDEGLI